MHKTARNPDSLEVTALELRDVAAPVETIVEPPAADLTGAEWAIVSEVADAAIAAVERLGSPISQISRNDLPEILELHLKWLTSDRAAGRQADLSGAQLEGVNLTGADLRFAVLHNTNLAGADLFMAQLRGAVLSQANLSRAGVLGASFHQADLQYANLAETVGLTLDQLAGSKLRGAVLPESLCESEDIGHLRKLTRRATTILAAIICICTLACVRIFTVSDVQLVNNAGAVPFPYIRDVLPLTAFFLAAPVLLLGLFVALHVSLIRLWQAISIAPAEFSGGIRSADCGSWLIMGLGFGQFEWLPTRETLLSSVESFVAKVVAYWIFAITLMVFWARYLTIQDLRGSILHSLLVASAVALSIASPDLDVSRFFARRINQTVPKSLIGRLLVPWRPTLVLATCVGFSLLSLGVVYGAPYPGARTVNGDTNGIRTWATGILWLFHFDPYANLSAQDLSTKPANWKSEDNSLDAVAGARMRSARLPYANAYRSFLAKADLWNAQLDNADLSEADLRLADLHGSSLRFAMLNGAHLFRAKLDKSDLRGAKLFSADLGEASLSFALLGEATLDRAKLDLASLYRADLHGAQLTEATLEGADLREANLQHATLARANLRNSYLSSAKLSEAIFRGAQLGHADLTQTDLSNADLRDADLQSAILTGSSLGGAKLQGANLRGASGLTVMELCKAHINGETQFDEWVALQVNLTCAQR